MFCKMLDGNNSIACPAQDNDMNCSAMQVWALCNVRPPKPNQTACWALEKATLFSIPDQMLWCKRLQTCHCDTPLVMQPSGRSRDSRLPLRLLTTMKSELPRLGRTGANDPAVVGAWLQLPV